MLSSECRGGEGKRKPGVEYYFPTTILRNEKPKKKGKKSTQKSLVVIVKNYVDVRI